VVHFLLSTDFSTSVLKLSERRGDYSSAMKLPAVNFTLSCFLMRPSMWSSLPHLFSAGDAGCTDVDLDIAYVLFSFYLLAICYHGLSSESPRVLKIVLLIKLQVVVVVHTATGALFGP